LEAITTENTSSRQICLYQHRSFHTKIRHRTVTCHDSTCVKKHKGWKNHLEQRGPNTGTRAACGPRTGFSRPANAFCIPYISQSHKDIV